MRQTIRKLARESRKMDVFWRYGFNFLPSLNYRLSSAKYLNPVTSGILEKINRDGIALTTIDELSELKPYYAELEAEVNKQLNARDEELKNLKAQANASETIGQKTFNVELLGSRVDFAPESIYARFGLQETFLNIANAYFGMLVKLRYYNVWYTFATRSKPRESQLWHYDREDNYILKVFMYLKDVDEGAGPFTYAPGTHRKGILNGREPEYFLEDNVRRTTDEQMSEVVTRENWITATGKKGTIVFADTRGFHKGGEARTSDRLMFTCMFTSPASESKRLLHFPADLQTANLNKKQLSALEIQF